MTSYVVILNGQIVQDKPVTTSLVTALRDNPIAIAEGDANAPRVKPVILHVQDQKSAGTEGGAFNNGAWRTRTLNTVVTNNITGASLASNQITLPAGSYDFHALAPAGPVQRHKAKLRNITDGTDTLLGTSASIASAASDDSSLSIVRGRFTIASAKVFELQHQCSNSATPSGFGIASNFAVIEVYADVHITKVA